jgi:putative chitinase
MIDSTRFEAAVHALATKTARPEVLDNLIGGRQILSEFGIDTMLKAAHFLSQTAHESGGFNIAIENLRYSSADRLTKVWPRRFPTAAAAALYVNNPEKLANNVYANRLGNGPPESGDGFRYRGRGLLQLTGRANYAAVGQLIDLPLEQKPELAEQAEHCLRIACGAWKRIGAAALPESASVEAYTREVNGGTIGLDDRQAKFAIARRAMGL